MVPSRSFWNLQVREPDVWQWRQQDPGANGDSVLSSKFSKYFSVKNRFDSCDSRLLIKLNDPQRRFWAWWQAQWAYAYRVPLGWSVLGFWYRGERKFYWVLGLSFLPSWKFNHRNIYAKPILMFLEAMQFEICLYLRSVEFCGKAAKNRVRRLIGGISFNDSLMKTRSGDLEFP